MGADHVPVKADRGDHVAATKIPVRDYYGSGGVWVRCATCGGIHYATVSNT